MKKILALTISILCCTGITAQKKSKDQNSIVGKWCLIECSGGFTGKGNGWTKKSKVVMEFKKDGVYKQYEKGKLKTQDAYAVYPRKAQSTEDFNKILDYGKSMDQVFIIRNDSLFLEDDVRDGYNYVLVRKK